MTQKKETLYLYLKKKTKKNIKNYCLVSLIPICSKAFERIKYGNILKKFLDSNLIFPKQSGFKPGDSYVS